jgi:hypothetical protein
MPEINREFDWITLRQRNFAITIHYQSLMSLDGFQSVLDA